VTAAPGGPGGPSELPGLPSLPGVRHSVVTVPTGLRMHVAEAGDPDAPAVLLLHGFPQHWWEWRKVIPALAERYRVLAPDLRGAGWTDAPSGGRYGTDRLAADVLGLLDALGVSRVGLVAHDVGALVGYRLCFDHAERVAGYLCLGPHPYVRFQPRMLAALPRLWFQPVLATPGLGPRALRGDRLARHLLRGGTASPESVGAEDLRVFADRLNAPGHAAAASALYRHLVLPEVWRLATGADRRRRLAVPTVCLLGNGDVGVGPGTLDADGAPADDLTGHVVQGAGHFLADDRPDVVVEYGLALFGRTL